MAAKHTPPGDDSFRTSLLRSGAGAVGLVAAVALVFGLIGGLGPSSDGPLVADGSEDSSGPAMEPEADEPEGDEGEAADEEDVASDDEDGEPVPTPDDADDEADGEQSGDEAESEPEPAESEPEAPEDDTDDVDQDDQDGQADPGDGDREFAPDSVTVQVLDGYQADGGSAAASVASELRETGYRVVAENPSLRYEVTTVLWTAGFEAQAHQVAADLGGAEVRPKPDNLSDQVQVHVVVGADRA